MVAPRRRSSAARLITATALFLIAAGVALQSVEALASFALGADVRDLAESIEQGHTPDAAYLARFAAANGLDRPSRDCGDSITRARLTVALADLEAARGGADVPLLDEAQKDALEIAGHRLQCNPRDGNAWLRYAEVLVETGGPTRAAIDSLRLSYWAAPNESWIMEARLPFATRLHLAGATGFESEYLEDLRRFVAYEPGREVARVYVDTTPRIRALLHPLIAALPENHEKGVVAEIDRLGMLFDGR